MLCYDLLSWGSLFQTEAFEERRVAGMASKDDAADRRCFRPGTSATRRTSDDKYPRAVPLTQWNIIVASLNVIRSGTRSQ